MVIIVFILVWSYDFYVCVVFSGILVEVPRVGFKWPLKPARLSL